MCKMYTTVSTELRSKTDLSTGSVRIPFGTMCCTHSVRVYWEKIEAATAQQHRTTTTATAIATACDDNDYINGRDRIEQTNSNWEYGIHQLNETEPNIENIIYALILGIYIHMPL